jgi:hypothetical protein
MNKFEKKSNLQKSIVVVMDTPQLSSYYPYEENWGNAANNNNQQETETSAEAIPQLQCSSKSNTPQNIRDSNFTNGIDNIVI